MGIVVMMFEIISAIVLAVETIIGIVSMSGTSQMSKSKLLSLVKWLKQ